MFSASKSLLKPSVLGLLLGGNMQSASTFSKGLPSVRLRTILILMQSRSTTR